MGNTGFPGFELRISEPEFLFRETVSGEAGLELTIHPARAPMQREDMEAQTGGTRPSAGGNVSTGPRCSALSWNARPSRLSLLLGTGMADEH